MSRRFPVWAVALIIGTLVMATPVAAAQDRRSPTTPTNLRITASTTTSVSLAWDASTDSSKFWYCVQRNGGGCVRVDPPRTTLTLTKLLPDRTHTFSVYAVDIAGNRSANCPEPEFALGLLSIILVSYPASPSGVRVRGWCNR